VEGTKKREKPRKRWRDDVEEDLNIMGVKKNGTHLSGTIGHKGRLYSKPLSTTDCSAGGGGGGE
jgi:hypothetical protein